MPIKQTGLTNCPESVPCCAPYVRMSERIRAYTDEAQELESATDFSYDDASADVTDTAIDFHFGVMDVAEMGFRKMRAAKRKEEETPPASEVSFTEKPASVAGETE